MTQNMMTLCHLGTLKKSQIMLCYNVCVYKYRQHLNLRLLMNIALPRTGTPAMEIGGFAVAPLNHDKQKTRTNTILIFSRKTIPVTSCNHVFKEFCDFTCEKNFQFKSVLSQVWCSWAS